MLGWVHQWLDAPVHKVHPWLDAPRGSETLRGEDLSGSNQIPLLVLRIRKTTEESGFHRLGEVSLPLSDLFREWWRLPWPKGWGTG